MSSILNRLRFASALSIFVALTAHASSGVWPSVIGGSPSISTFATQMCFSGGGCFDGASGTGSVTSVDLALPTSVFTLSGGPVTTSGTLTGTFATQAANQAFMGPVNGSPGVPAFRALVAADIPNISAAKITSGQGSLTSSTSGVTAVGTNAGLAAMTVDVQTASGSQPGLLSSTDWTTFNGKQAALTPGNASSSTTGVTVTGTAATVGPAITVNVQTATTSQPGLLSAADWTTFNGKYNLPSLTSGSVLFSDGSTITQDNALLFWDGTNHHFIVGGNPGSIGPINSQVEIFATSGSDHAINIFTESTNNAIEVQAGNANVMEMSYANNSGAGGAAITLERARGTPLAKTQMLAGDVYGGLFFQGYTGSAFTGFGAAIAAVATENITGTNSGGELVFTVSPNGTNAGSTPALILGQDFSAAFTGVITAPQGVDLTTSGSQPSCTVTNRGLVWNVQGGTGVADLLQVCQKTVADTYAWVTH